MPLPGAPVSWPPVKRVGGSSVAMPDTGDNPAEYPPPTTQTAGCGFSVARIVGGFDLITGALAEVPIGALSLGDLMWEAGLRHRAAPLRLSFKSAMEETMVTWPCTAAAAQRCDLSKLYTSLLAAIASHSIPLRSNRSEPRVRKRRPRNTRLMTTPRHDREKRQIKKRP